MVTKREQGRGGILTPNKTDFQSKTVKRDIE